MQKILLYTTKASYALFSTCDKLLQDRTNCHDVLKLIIDSLALLGLLTLEINHLGRQLMKHRLTEHLKSHTKYVPPAQTYLFGDDLNKRMSLIQQTNTELQRPPKGNNGNHHSRRPYSKSSNKLFQRKNYQIPQRSSAQGKKGTNKQSRKY